MFSSQVNKWNNRQLNYLAYYEKIRSISFKMKIGKIKKH